jgi:hypothetical protein
MKKLSIVLIIVLVTFLNYAQTSNVSKNTLLSVNNTKNLIGLSARFNKSNTTKVKKYLMKRFNNCNTIIKNNTSYRWTDMIMQFLIVN